MIAIFLSNPIITIFILENGLKKRAAFAALFFIYET